MVVKKQGVLILILSVLFVVPGVKADNYILKDAENFAALFSENSKLSSESIQKRYLDVGTKGIDIFTPYRIQNASNLLSAITNNKHDYEKALKVCLPAARNLNVQANDMLEKIKNLLKQDFSAPVYILFGANNSGGTATEAGLSLGLEVLCQFAETEEEFKEVLLAFIAHEVVHVYQSHLQLYSQTKESDSPTLLVHALVEGVADFMAYLALGKITQSEVERHKYGLENESKTWLSFKSSMHKTELGDWMYKQGLADKPSDMGYWVGKRIAEAYYNNAQDKSKALKELLLLEDPVSILTISGYDPVKK